MTRRDPWAILYAALLFGSIAIPYCYLALHIAGGLLFKLPLQFIFPSALLLNVSAAPLLFLFIAQTPLERRLRQRVGRSFSVMLAILVVAAAGVLGLLTLAMMNPLPFMLPAQSWFYFIAIAASTTAVAGLAVTLRLPSRLERAIATRLDRDNPRHRAYRVAGYIALLCGLVFLGFWLNQFYLYSRYCGGIVEQQDYIECHYR